MSIATSTILTLLDPREIHRTLITLVPENAIFEIRVPEGFESNPNFSSTYSGYFRNDEEGRKKVINELHRFKGFEAVWFSAHIVDPALLARANHRIKKVKKNFATSNENIMNYHLLLIDCDPVRARGISSSNNDHQLAIDFARFVRDTLTEYGFPQPVLGDSGNGAHLEYLINLPNIKEINEADTGLFHRFLKGLEDAVGVYDGIKIDQTVFNPARMWKLYGTRACKGDHSPEIGAPWRMARILEAPESLVEVSRDLIEKIAIPIPEKEEIKKKTTSTRREQPKSSNASFDALKFLEDFIAKYNISIRSSDSYKGGTRFVLEHCAFNSEHAGTDACLYAFPDGISYKCSHNSCQDYGWQEFRTYYEPDAYNKPKKERLQFSAIPMEGDFTDLAINNIRRQITAFLEQFDPFKTDEGLFQHGLSQILCQLPCTDNANAIRLSARFGHRIRYVSEQKDFYVWTGKRWMEDLTGNVMGYARQTAEYIEQEVTQVPLPCNEQGEPLKRPKKQKGGKQNKGSQASDDPGQPEKKEQELSPEEQAIEDQFLERGKVVAALKKWVAFSQSRVHITAMMDLLTSERKTNGGAYDTTIVMKDLDSHDWLLNCTNGTLNLEDPNNIHLLPHNPEHLITKLAPTHYDPNALHPAYWDKFINKVCGWDPDVVQFMQDLVGCGLIGRQLDDILAIVYGPGGNGKYVFAETIKECLGEYAWTAPSDLLLEKKNESIKNDQAGLNGVRFLTMSETDEGRRLSEATVKALTGGDPQQVRFLYKNNFEMIPRFTGILFTNHRPVINGTDKGIWRRVKLIPWMHDFEHDPEVEAKHVVMRKMAAEHSAILNWAIAGLIHRMQSHLISVPSAIAIETTQYRQQSDAMLEFIEDYCVVDEIDAEIDRKELYEQYCEFAEESGQKQNRIASIRGFLAKLRERSDLPYFRDGRKSGATRYLSGIRLLKEDEAPHRSKCPNQQDDEEISF